MNSLSVEERAPRADKQVAVGLFDDLDSSSPALPVGGKPVLIDFTGGELTSDAGLLALREVDRRIGLTEAVADQVFDERDPRYTRHTMLELLRQRVYAIAAGYEDASEAAALRDDPVLKMTAERLPGAGEPLASQPTLSRFENTPCWKDLGRIMQVLLDQFVASYAEPPEVIVLDFDDTDYRTYGDQQLALFNTHYGGYCYLPLHVYEGLSGRLVTTLLKPKQLKGTALRAILRRLVTQLRKSWPETLIVFRGDSHFARPEVMDWIEAQQNLCHVTGLTPNKALKRRSQAIRQKARRLYASRLAAGETEPKVVCFGMIRYRAGTWSRARRVVVKVEKTAKGTNTRFVVSDLDHIDPRRLYKEIYLRRGTTENYVKDHKRYLRSDKMSCHRFEANQFRLLLHSVAYVLFDTLRREVLRGTEWSGATIETLRLKLVKLAARVRELKTRIKVELSTGCPVRQTLQQSFLRLVLVPPG